MANVEDRIVRIEFDNASFEKKISTTLASITELNKALQFNGAKNGLDGISKAAQGVDISHIGNAVDATVRKFSTLGVVGFTAIQNITNSVFSLAKKLGGDLLGPIITGGTNRARNIEQAKFQFEGLGVDVTKAMQSSLNAVKGTAFGLDEAAKAAAQFAASGIDAGSQMEGALRGIAGAAALTGTSFSEMAQIFTSSAGTGVVNTQDLMQFGTRGLNAAAAVGKVLGKTEQQVRDMASQGKLDFKTFADAMDKAFGQHAKDANKTFTGALANMKAALSRLGASVVSPLDTQQRDVLNSFTPVIDNFSAALQPIFTAFLNINQLLSGSLIKHLNSINFTGIQSLAKAAPHFANGITNAFIAVLRVFRVVKAAFRDIFPKQNVSLLLSIAIAFENFTKKLQAGSSTLSRLRVIFDGVFSALSIGWTVLKEGVKFVTGLVTALLGAQKGNVLNFFVKLAQFVGDLQKELVLGGGIKDFFNTLTEAVKQPIPFLQKLRDFIVGFFTGFKPAAADAVSNGVGRISDRFENLRQTFDKIRTVLSPFLSFLGAIGSVLGKVGQAIGNVLGKIGQAIRDSMKSGDFNAALDALNTAIFGGFLLILHRFLKDGARINLDLGKGIFTKLGFTINELTGVLKAMQTQIRADALKKIAEAIAILTASVLVLSLIDSAKLTKALTAMAVGFGQLMASFAILNQMSAQHPVKFTVIAAGMNAIATAILILAGATAILGSMDFGTLLKGLVGVAALLAIVTAAAFALQDVSPTLILTGIGLSALGIALTILAGAMKVFATMSWGDIGKGLVGVASALLAIGLSMQVMPVTLPITAAGIVILSAGLLILQEAIKKFVDIKAGDLAKGITAIAVALLAIGIAMQAMPPALPITGAGLILVGIGLEIVAKALQSFGSMSWGEIAKGLVALAGSLVILAVGVTAMSGALAGAVALGIIAVSLAAFAKVMDTFGAMDWGDLIQSMLKIAATLGILALAALLIGPAIPVIAGLGIALGILGGAFALFGVGAFLAAKAFETLSKAAKNGSANVIDAMKSLGQGMPALAQGFAEGFISFAKVIGDNAPTLIAAFTKILIQLLDATVKMAPHMHEAFTALMTAGLQSFIDLTPLIIQAGLNFLITFLNGVNDNIGKITDTVGSIIVNFLKAFADKIPAVQEQLGNILIQYILGAAFTLGLVAGTVLTQVGQEFIKGFVTGVTNSLPSIQTIMNSIPGRVLQWIGNVVGTLAGKGRDLIGGLLRGITDKWGEVRDWLAGLWSKISDAVGSLKDILVETGKAVIQGLWDGMKNIWDKVTGWLSNLDPRKHFNDINLAKGHAETNLVPTGEAVFMGLQKGMETGWDGVTKWLRTLDPSDAMSSTIASISSSIADMEEFKPSITPVLDLTKVQEDAAKIGAIVQTNPLAATVSLVQASSIATSTTASSESNSEKSPGGQSGITFTQIINAPEQLSTKDIYKNTRNQISMAKEDLKIS